jgi:hypothetical protein
MHEYWETVNVLSLPDTVCERPNEVILQYIVIDFRGYRWIVIL